MSWRETVTNWLVLKPCIKTLNVYLMTAYCTRHFLWSNWSWIWMAAHHSETLVRKMSHWIENPFIQQISWKQTCIAPKIITLPALHDLYQSALPSYVLHPQPRFIGSICECIWLSELTFGNSPSTTLSCSKHQPTNMATIHVHPWRNVTCLFFSGDSGLCYCNITAT